MPSSKVMPYLNANICSQAEAWKMAYDIIKLENDLINHRVTALLVTNGFFVAALRYSDKIPFDTCMYFNIFSIALAALIITWTLGCGIAAASRQILKSAQWYYAYCRENLIGPSGSFSPPIIGYRTAWRFLKIPLGKTVPYENERVISENSLGALGTGICWLVNALLIFWAAIFVYAIYNINFDPIVVLMRAKLKCVFLLPHLWW